jgi:hypothetical protein
MLPPRNRIVHEEERRHGRLFQVSDRDIYARLGLLRKECGNIAALTVLWRTRRDVELIPRGHVASRWAVI